MKTEPDESSQIENSTELRISCLAMTLLSIFLAFYYINASIYLIVTCLTTIFVGNYLSYHYRAKKNLWLSSLATLMTLVIMGNFAYSIFLQWHMGNVNLLVPFIAALAELQSLHGLDFRTKSDANTSLLIGLTLLGATATVGRDIFFAAGFLLYSCFAAFFLYRQSVAFTIGSLDDAKNVAKIVPNAATSLPSLTQSRGMAGSTIITVIFLPVCSLLISLAIPHIESTLDKLTTALFKTLVPSTFNLNNQSNVVSVGRRRFPSTDQKPSPPPKKRGVASPASKTKSESNSKSGTPGVPHSVTSMRQIVNQTKSGKVKIPGNKKQFGDSKLEAPDKNKAAKTNPASHPSINGSKNEGELSLLSADKKKFADTNELLFTVKSSRCVFLKRLAFDNFDGTRWYLDEKRPTKTIETNPEYFTSLASPEDSKPADHSVEVNQEITAKAELGHSVPCAWRAVQITIPSEKISIDEADNLQIKALIEPGFSYKVLSNMPIYNLPDLRGHLDDYSDVLVARRDYKEDLTLPGNIAEKTTKLAKKIVGKETRWFVQAEMICNYLKTNFKYSLTCQDKEGLSPIDDFLFVSKTGDCTRYASAFAVLCRSLKIPTRCIAGFAPGPPNLATGLMEIRTPQTHAWAEIYLPPSGWVPFDAVPGGYLPDSKPSDTLMGQLAKSEFEKQTQRIEALKRRLSEKFSLNSFLNRVNGGESFLNPLRLWLQHKENMPIILAAAVLGVLLLYLVGKTYLVAQQRRKFRQSTVLFLEVMDYLKKIQIKRAAGDTPEEIMTKVQSRLEQLRKPKWQIELPELLSSFFDSYCLNRFNAADSPDLTAELRIKKEQIQKVLASAR